MKTKGFTLIELLIAVAIFAVISSIAIPLYTQYSQRGFRTELMSDLLNCAQAMERFNAINFTYVGTNPGGDDTALAPAVCNPASVQAGRYAITAVTTVDTYVLTAVPAGSMAGTGNLTISETGARTWDEANDGLGAGDNDWNES